MSLGVELALARLAVHFGNGGPVILYSEFGLGGCLVETVSPLLRVADRPLCGMRPLPIARLDQAVDLAWTPRDAERVLGLGPVFVDSRSEGVEAALARLAASGAAPVLLRLRGDGQVPPGFVDVFHDGPETLCVAAGEGDAAKDAIAPVSAERRDEFDTLNDHLGAGTLLGVRHGAGVSALMVNPISVIDAPDAEQLATALGEGRAVTDSAGGAALAIPILTSDAPFGIALGGLQPNATVQIAGAEIAKSGWENGLWQITFAPAGPIEAAIFEIEGAPGAEIVEVWTGIKRRRSGLEDWDEADAQLKLEESW